MESESAAPVDEAAELVVSAAAVVVDGRLLVVSKKAAPDFFYLPGGKPEPGESAREALVRELREELGVTPVSVTPLTEVRATAALEGVPMRLTVFSAALEGRPAPAAEIAALRWTDGTEGPGLTLAPAVRNHVMPLLPLG
ncbi:MULTISPECIES: NUDIX domain-containing protein [unclassified Streptomyces]|uniref:NUDIX hydrolase n=1 Tax=unclassified Streptomyces TaxID=2593676 RepID=UPI002DD8146D|nr:MULTISPECIES: NUDIX domain-containing protein [unclassified Streptomyces]WSA91713.1 NUDIX domain-containing protein [Streptomyces sp. NBC_01795]WSB76085.1 NUDIX domain-containing protein [Streptomyces sp. NBC_01775]WSS15641.1 NUDIX domain-containing protein [Streptomyces sp. NBC_01186]WSS44483.1 NUDIX domain-containing protein [Streptomyces sp. NBC_01187]